MSRLLPLALFLLFLAGCAGHGDRKWRHDPLLWDTPTFIKAHPDVHERKRGLWLMDENRLDEAVVAFTRAARHADKASQALLAELHWDGFGVVRDPSRAYAWMDLAAERGYTVFVAKREAYWHAMTIEERAEALRIGADLYAEYGDAVARPRMETLLRRARSQITGSRVGYVGGLTVLAPTQLGWQSFSGQSFYHDDFWRPSSYFEWTDSLWQDAPEGSVSVGEPSPRDPLPGG